MECPSCLKVVQSTLFHKQDSKAQSLSTEQSSLGEDPVVPPGTLTDFDPISSHQRYCHYSLEHPTKPSAILTIANLLLVKMAVDPELKSLKYLLSSQESQPLVLQVESRSAALLSLVKD